MKELKGVFMVAMDYEQRKQMADERRIKISAAQHVSVVGFDMPFMDMVSFMVKWALASIPAAVILFVVGFAIVAVFGGLVS